MSNPKVNGGRGDMDLGEKTVIGTDNKKAISGGETNDAKGIVASDQDRFTRGIRDLSKNDSGDGSFIEAEQLPSDRRDPEESRYNEAGQRIVTQGDVEDAGFISKKANPEGGKISNSQPQTAL